LNSYFRKYLILSIFGALFILAFALLVPADNAQVGNNEKNILGLVFIICCTIGITLAVKPDWLRSKIGRSFQSTSKQNAKVKNIEHKGHHPDCRRFLDHTIMLGERTVCAGCLGLAVGSMISIIITILYIEATIVFPRSSLFIMIIAGLFFIALNYTESVLVERMVLVHISFNLILPLGFLLITIGIFELYGELIFGLIVILISILWLDTRIQISEWTHNKICFSCTNKCVEN
jgi:hypothetical protein